MKIKLSIKFKLPYLYFLVCAVVLQMLSACSKAEDPAPLPQSELNKGIVGEDILLQKFYYTDWTPEGRYVDAFAVASYVLEYEIEGCQKVAVTTFNKYPFDICKDGTTIIVNDISRYNDDDPYADPYIPLKLKAVEISYGNKTVLYTGESLTTQQAISWKHIDTSLYELKFAPNTSSDIQKIRINLDFDDPIYPAPDYNRDLYRFDLHFRQLNK